jgi:cytochrome P450
MAVAASLRKDSRTPPGPRGVPLLGIAPEAWKDPIAFFLRAWREYGDVVCSPEGPYSYFALVDADAARHVLVENAKNYVKSPSYRGLRAILGNGLVTSDGDFWRRQRKLAQPAFHRAKVAGFLGAMVADTEAMLARWATHDVSKPLDVQREMMRLNLRIVGHTLFSVDLDGESMELGPVVSEAVRSANDEATAVFPLPMWVPTPTHLRIQRVVKRLDDLVLTIVGERRRIIGTDRAPNDLLSMLMSAQDEETREQMTDRQLRDEVLTLALAGHETTASALTWTFYLLSKHPEIARRLGAEVDAVLGGRAPRLEDFARLPLTRAVIEESMRLYPPVWAVERRALGDDVLGGYHVPKGAIVGVVTYAIHRHPKHWDNPEGFDPDRFLAGRSEARHRYAYLPFGAGPRTCIGNGMAMMNAELVLAMVAQRYRLDLAAGEDVQKEATVTLRPKRAVPMLLRPRGVPAQGTLSAASLPS